jgi:hypothetical protein
MKSLMVKAFDRWRTESRAMTAAAKVRPHGEIIDHLFSPSEADRPGLRSLLVDMTIKPLCLRVSCDVPIAGPRKFLGDCLGRAN